jgi:hypothetical protein
MVFHMDSIREFKSYLQSWSFATIVVINIDVRGGRISKGEKHSLIAMENVNLTKMFFILNNNL